MKKLFTLLTLALMSIGSAWGETVVLSTPESSMATYSDASGIITITDATSKTGIQVGSGSFTYDDKSYTPMKLSGSRQFNLSYKEGASITKVTLIGTSNNDKEATLGVSSKDRTSLGTLPAKGSEKPLIVDITGVEGLNASAQFLAVIVVEYSLTTPNLTVSPSSLTLAATVYSPKASETFTLTGSNLTDGTYSLTIPSIDGLSVSPASFTVSGGKVVTTDDANVFTVTYEPKTDADEETVRISTPTIKSVSAVVAITYSANLTLDEQVSVSEETTWDWSNAGVKDIELTDDTSPSKVDEFVMSNLSGVTNDATFNSQALVLKKVQYPVRDGKYMQGNQVSFKTSVAGTIVVEFSNTGNREIEEENRYLNVNGVNSDFKSLYSKETVTTDPIAVPAGDVVLKGVLEKDGSDQFLRFYKIIFTPSEESDGVVITPATEYSTYVTTDNIDFTDSELKAYVAVRATSAGVALVEVADVPAGTPLILIGTKGKTYEVPFAAATHVPESPSVNLLKAGDGTTTIGGDSNYDYVLKDGKFYRANEGTVAVGKAYLHLDAAPEAHELTLIFGDDVTGIQNVKVGTEDNVYYDLQGRRVLYPKKGLYIVNGKKVILK
ncbi:MAG: hypothetical protein IJ069_02520 [Prevotella sp.]|nr:hypothetical protein [Prevotella sp.]